MPPPPMTRVSLKPPEPVRLWAIQVRSGYDGETYRIDTPDREMAAEWLLQMALKFGPSQGGIHAPMQISICGERWE